MALVAATNRTTHLLELMKQGDDVFNRADFEAMSAVHDEHLVCHMMGSAEPIIGDTVHRAAMQGMMRSFPDVHIQNDPYPIQFGQGDWTTVVTRHAGTFTGEMTGPNGKRVPPPPERRSTCSLPRLPGGAATSSPRSGSSGIRRCCSSRLAWRDDMPNVSAATVPVREDRTATPITTIVHFSMPKEHVDEFFAIWTKIKEVMLKQPGALHGAMHRSIDDDSPFQFVNVAQWESPEALANPLRASAEDFKSRGTDIATLMQRLDIRVSQNNYAEEIRY